MVAVRDLLESSPTLAIVATAEGTLTYLNAAARAHWPAPPATLAELLPGAPLDAPAFEWGTHDRVGATSWFHVAVSALPDGARLVLATDALALKQSEERLRRSEKLLVDTQGVAHLGTWEWDVSQPTATWSAELYRIYGLTPETYTPSYEQYLTKVHPDDRQRVIDATNRVFHEHVPYSHDERIFLPDGSLRYLHTWAYPIVDADGTLRRLIGVCQDITDRALIEAQLENRVADRTRALETSMRDLEAFNSMVSHDLRAPLAVIQMSADLLEHDAAELPGRPRDTIARIRRAVEQMTMLVEDLLALARVGHGTLAQADVDVSVLCDEIVADLRRDAPHRDAEISIARGIRCHADPGLLRAALANLLSNAWKYSSRAASARIEVDIVDRTLIVRDNGVGFDMADAGKLFAPFERLHDPSVFPGTGIGLATVHRIVERHGGQIRAESAPGRGAAFLVTMPGLRVV